MVDIVSPLEISNCILWVSSDDMLTKIVGGTGAPIWTDLSPFAHHLSAALPGNSPILSANGGKNNGPAMQFSSAALNGFNLPAGVASKVNASDGATIIATFQTGSRGDEGMWAMQNGTDRPMSHAPSGGRVYDGALGSGRWDWAATSSTWYRYLVLSNKNPLGNPNWSCSVNGISVVNAALQAGYGLRTDAVIGHSLGSGGVPNFTFGGKFGAIVIYDRLLNPTEQAQIDTFLTTNPSGGLVPLLVPPLYVGSTKVSKLYQGTNEITTAYVGSTKL